MKIAKLMTEHERGRPAAHSLYVQLPDRWLYLAEVDLTRAALVFQESDPPRVRLRPLDVDVTRYGLERCGSCELLKRIVPLAEVVAKARQVVEKNRPFRLTGDWYLGQQDRFSEVLTNGAWTVDETARFKCSKRKRPIILDPIGLGPHGELLFPMARALELLEREEGTLADPYAWSKRYIPGGRSQYSAKGVYEHRLVVS